jgi:serine/threonine protein kinase, bacterial
LAIREFRERFNREADVVAALYHPHVVGIHDRGEFDGQLWISMDYIDGTDVGRLLRERFPRGMPPREVAEIVSAVADALDCAHDNGLLHRDVKPANILISQPPSGRRRVLLADFGISRWLADTSGLTQTNMALGTVSYAAPEQLTGEPVDGRADQYALAATTYQLLTGSPPFEHSNPAVVVGQHLNSPPPTLASRLPALGPLDAVMQIALAKKSDDRFSRCSQFAEALASQIAGGEGATDPVAPTVAAISLPKPPTAPLPVAEPRANAPVPVSTPRSQWPLVVGAVAIALIIAGVVLAFRPWQSGQATSTPATATTSASQSMTPAGVSTLRTAQVPTITFDAMRDFITGYYGELPARMSDAWAKLDVGYQQRTGLSDYLKFWSTVQSVTVISVSPRDNTSVVAHMQYAFNDGHVLTEDRWFRVVTVDDGLLISDSEVVS